MNLAIKYKPWMIASLLAATSLFGQDQTAPQQSAQSAPPACQPAQPKQQPCPPPACQPKPPCQPQPCQPCQPKTCKPAKCGTLQAPQAPTVCAYNAPAEINIGIDCEYDFFAAASFLYWLPLQDNMIVAINDSLPASDFSGARNFKFKGNCINMDFDFKPGFKVALGMNLQNDDWVGYAEYTRWHGRHTVSASSNPADPRIWATLGNEFLVLTSPVFATANASFNCNLDFIDGILERVYYVGKSLIFNSAFGLRGAWILENIHAHYFNSHTGSFAIPGALDVVQRVHSWAVGPRAGLEMDWMLGEGFRFFGSVFADILYTKYKVQDKSLSQFSSGTVQFFITHNKVPAVRAHLDIETGFGWGMYIGCCNDWHIDLSAAYGFQAFFKQNMFPTAPSYQQFILEGSGDLYVQGLTLTARLDF